jgi:hypothetical protein
MRLDIFPPYVKPPAPELSGDDLKVVLRFLKPAFVVIDPPEREEPEMAAFINHPTTWTVRTVATALGPVYAVCETVWKEGQPHEKELARLDKKELATILGNALTAAYAQRPENSNLKLPDLAMEASRLTEYVYRDRGQTVAPTRFEFGDHVASALQRLSAEIQLATLDNLRAILEAEKGPDEHGNDKNHGYLHALTFAIAVIDDMIMVA